MGTESAELYVDHRPLSRAVAVTLVFEGMRKPIRIFYSDITGIFYATRAYRETKPGIVEVTGEKFDVTQDIARIIVEKGVRFAPRRDQP